MSAPAQPRALPRVLLLEPQFVLRRTIALVSRDLCAFDFHEASSAGRARTLLAGQAYAGLVLDLQEGAPVFELLHGLRQGQFATHPHAWAIVLTAGLDAGEGARLQALGVAQVLPKPVKISTLLQSLAYSHAKATSSAGAALPSTA